MNSVLVAISGGVDSSVCAALLKNKGYNVVGITFKHFDSDHINLNDSSKSCCSLESANNARKVCDSLEIPHYIVNRIEKFQEYVLNNFKETYLRGHTPNPCIRCNSLVRWPEMISLADKLDIQYIATGHYARIVKTDDSKLIGKAVSSAKDQSYALWSIKPEHLKRTLLPIGEYTKKQVREFARGFKLKTADYPESQDICFVPEGKYSDLIGESHPGDIVDVQGNVIGGHKGLVHYTIGQRRGLGISNPEPLYVLQIDSGNNRLTAGPEHELYKTKFNIAGTNWFIEVAMGEKIKCLAKIRYHHMPAECVAIISENNTASVSFEQPQRAITPGQSAVFYDSDGLLLGGGVIENVF